MPLSPDEHQEFARLVSDTTGYRERECTPYLKVADDLLLGQSPVLVVDIATEKRSPYGRSDYIVVADLKSDTGQIDRHMIFWELKAPQCAIVEVDDAATRFRPTKDLIKAETQLLHYVYEAARNRDLQERFGIRYAENIRMGGIIIGRSSSIAAQNANSDDAFHSLRIRQSHIYNKAGIRLLTWDRIVDFATPQ